MSLGKVYVVGILCVSLMCIAECRFSPRQNEEDMLVNCIMHRRYHGAGTCRKKIYRLAKVYAGRRVKRFKCLFSRVTGTVAGIETSNLDAAKDYICALNSFQNTKRNENDAKEAVSSLGSCGHFYPSVLKTWKSFLGKREYGTILLPPTRREKNGSLLTVYFNATGSYGAKYSLDDIKAVDIVISRSLNEKVEFFGKYLITVSAQLAWNPSQVQDRISVHESLQATCPSDYHRYFVGGLNKLGLREVATWFTSGDKTLQLTADVISERQVIKAADGTFLEEKTDVIEGISAIVLHVTQPVDRSILRQILRVDDNEISERHRAMLRVQRDLKAFRRYPRSQPPAPDTDSNCHREKFIQNYAQNEIVLSPQIFDIGECEGRCDEILSPELNATNHAITMVGESWRNSGDENPKPSVCCVPISYRNFYYVTEDERGYLMGSYVKNMVTEYCGCR